MIQNKLVESWLDNQGERRYQPALIQLLIAEGWTVLHNTRHSPIEFGKDVIARDPSGKICALQLKGNPGSRLTKSEAQIMLPQFIEAMESEIPRSYGRLAKERHRTIIVTNGEIDEEARELFDRTSVRTRNKSCPSDGASYWTRGDLLKRFSSKVQEIWPASIEGLSEAIKLYGEEGFITPPPEQIATILQSAVGFIQPEMKSPEKSSKVSNIFLLTEILKSPWYKTKNHYVLFQISIIAATYSLQFCSANNAIKLFHGYCGLILSHAQDLFEECRQLDYDPSNVYASRSPLSEVDIMIERARMIADVVACLVISGILEEKDRGFARAIIEGSIMPGCLWGQHTVPSLIVRHWAWRKLDARINPEMSMISLLSGYIMASENHHVPDRITNAAPYYNFDHVLHAVTNGVLGEESDITQDQTRYHMSFGKSLFYMLALRNLKQTCKAMWPRFSRMMHGSTEVPVPNFFSPRRSESGITISEQFYAKSWNDLVNEAINDSASEKLDLFHDQLWLAAAYICISPHRAEYNFIMSLDERISKRWYHQGHRPGDPILPLR